MAFQDVEITPRSAEQIKNGSLLWIFSNEFVTKAKDLRPGAWVNFQSKGKFVGFGYVNPNSLIRGRVCSLIPVSDRKELIVTLLKKSVERRRDFFKVGSYRAVFSESDFLPGLLVDVYGTP